MSMMRPSCVARVSLASPAKPTRRRRGVTVGVGKFLKGLGVNVGDEPTMGTVYGDLKRDDYTYDDVEQYYNYIGLNAIGVEYSVFTDPIEAGMHPADVILMLAAIEGDLPKIEEMAAAGADASAVNHEGKSVLECAKDDDTKEALKAVGKQA